MPRRVSRPLLCVGGFDPSGGAGVTADLFAARAVGGEAVAVLSTLTAQSSGEVTAVRSAPKGWLRAQIETLEDETAFGAVKTGLIADRRSILDLCEWYRRSDAGPLIVDPVLAAGVGALFLSGPARVALLRELLPLASLVTPNRSEAEWLTGRAVTTRTEMERAAREIGSRGVPAILLKGGHVDGPPADLLWDGRAMWMRSAVRLPGRWHGLGCHLASAIGARLALGDPLRDAVRTARAWLRRGMRRPRVFPSGRYGPDWSSVQPYPGARSLKTS